MNEQEIIEYLKENRKKGIGFCYMPDEVQNWCKKHHKEKIFLMWADIKYGWTTKPININCSDISVYTLPDDYEPKFKPHWQEFEIDKDGFFRIKKESYTYYCWFNWQKFLDDNFDKYNNFGGWVYEDPISDGKKTELLVTSPRIRRHDEKLTPCILFNGGKNESKPAYPTKILFWRYQE